MKCSQCERPAIVKYCDLGLCVQHYLMMKQAEYLEFSMLTAGLNFLRSQISVGTGGLTPHTPIEIPRPPFIGDSFTLNNINVAESTIGAINTGTIGNIDVGITMMQNQGQGDLAIAIKGLTEAILKSNELNESTKNEIAEQLEFLIAQVTAEPHNRSTAVVKSILAGIRDSISTAAGLLTLWERIEPLLRTAFGF